MKFEMSLTPVTQCEVDALGQSVWGEVNIVRAGIRTTSDKLLSEGLDSNKLVPLAIGIGQMMLIVAAAMVAYRVDPEVADLIEGAKLMVIQARDILDRGMVLHSPEMLAKGAVMMQLTCRGLAHALGLDYEGILLKVAEEVEITEFNIRPHSPQGQFG